MLSVNLKHLLGYRVLRGGGHPDERLHQVQELPAAGLAAFLEVLRVDQLGETLVVRLQELGDRQGERI